MIYPLFLNYIHILISKITIFLLDLIFSLKIFTIVVYKSVQTIIIVGFPFFIFLMLIFKIFEVIHNFIFK